MPQVGLDAPTVGGVNQKVVTLDKSPKPVRIRTVADLRKYLELNGLSPEGLAKITRISNMTIRRLLEKNPHTKIAEKYYAQFDRLTDNKTVSTENAKRLNVLTGDMTSLFSYVSSLTKSRKEGVKTKKIISLSQSYLSGCNLASVLKAPIARLSQAALRHPTATVRGLALGALIYFVTPLDFIPDITSLTGFLDDYAILSLVDLWIEAQAAIEVPPPTDS